MSGIVNPQRLPIRPLIPLCLAAFAGFLNLFGLNPFFAEVARELDTSVSLIGYSATAAMLTTALAGIVVGLLIERTGRVRRTLVVGLLVSGLGALVTSMASDISELIVSRVLAGVGGSITGGVTVAAAAMIYQGQHRQRAMAFVTASMAMGVVIGVVLMTSLAEPFGWRGAYVALGVMLVAISVLNVVMLDPELRESRNSISTRQQNSWFGPYRALLSNTNLRWLLLAACLHPAVMNGSTAYVGALLDVQHGLSTRWIGPVFSLIGATYVAGNLLAGHLRQRRPDPVFPLGVSAMGIFWFLGYVLPMSPVVSAGLFALATLTGGLAWVTLLSMIADRSPKNLAAAMVLASSLLSLGAAVGIATGAGLLDITEYTGIAIGMLLFAIGAAVSGLIGSRSPATQSEPAIEPGYGYLKHRRSSSPLEVEDGAGTSP